MDGYELIESKHDLPRATTTANRQTRRARRIKLSILSTFAIALFGLLYLYQTRSTVDTFPEPIFSSTLPQCPAPHARFAKAPAPRNIWAPLSKSEVTAVRGYLDSHKASRDLNLTNADDAAVSDNFIYGIEIYYPPKDAALAYLADPESADPPERYARVTIHHGGWEVPVVRDYLVGPLPDDSQHSKQGGLEGIGMRQLTEIYHRPDIPFNARGFDRSKEINAFLARIMPPFSPVLQDLFGAVPNSTLTNGASGPFSFDGGFRRTWLSWRINTPGNFLHPVGFWMYIDFSGTDPGTWKLLKILYNRQVFRSQEAFLEAWGNGSLKRLPKPDEDKKEDNLRWSTRRPVGPPPDLDHLPGPRSVSFAGLRFRVDREQQYISWMGWSMYLGFERDMGLNLWDVRIRGERLLYQLQPQEAMGHYAGNDPGQSTLAWMDRYFGMGDAASSLIPGYDCPHEAVYLPATTHFGQTSTTRDRAICIFEQDIGRPISRHVGWEDGEFGATRGYVLTVRSVSTVGNYEFSESESILNHLTLNWGILSYHSALLQFEYNFHMDGTIEVRLSASGYIQGGFWEDTQDAYGSRIRDHTMGSLHDHVINFKVDLDVAGRNNSFMQTTMKQESMDQPWFDGDDEEEWGNPVIQQKITRTIIENEDDARVKYPTNMQGGYAIVNQDEFNRWGVMKGYSIIPGYSPIHATVVGSKRNLHNANWAHHNLAVSKRKENEPSSSTMWNSQLPGAPPVDFDLFFDGENITQEDLVAWINVGTHHLPGSGDTPNTKTNTAASSFFLTPLNYFDYDISIDSTNAIILTAPENPNDAYEYDDHGVSDAHCAPQPPAKLVYLGPQEMDGDWKILKGAGVAERRRKAEKYHRIPMEL
ncbi:hypothetical protein HWV62_20073 [Athelia sp. TMB]|nr:hypothetical protein HWV62_20073 [Athelia sp. TMB]